MESALVDVKSIDTGNKNSLKNFPFALFYLILKQLEYLYFLIKTKRFKYIFFKKLSITLYIKIVSYNADLAITSTYQSYISYS